VRVMASWCSGTPVNTTGWKVGGEAVPDLDDR
jgi:hypothetical protein